MFIDNPGRLLRDIVENPEGKRFDISTICTVAGGAPIHSPPFSTTSSADFLEDTPWPFETMIYEEGNRIKGLYHEAYATEEGARRGHQRMIGVVKRGLEFGGGVTGEFGLPSMTASDWNTKIHDAKSR